MKKTQQSIKLLALSACVSLMVLTNCATPEGVKDAVDQTKEGVEANKDATSSDKTDETKTDETTEAKDMSKEILECGIKNPPTSGPAAGSVDTWKICVEQPDHAFNKTKSATGATVCEAQLDAVRTYVPSCDLDGKIKTAADNIEKELGDCAKVYACAVRKDNPDPLAISAVFGFHNALLAGDKDTTQQKCDKGSSAVVESVAPECKQ